MSRSIAYYALFSLFPFLLLVLSFSSSLLLVEETQRVVLDLIGRFLPAAGDLVQANIEQLLRTRGTIGLLAGLGLLWAASGVFSAIYQGVNRAWGHPRSHLFGTEKLYGLAVVLVVGLLLVATTGYSTLVNIARSWEVPFLGWHPFADAGLRRLLGWLSALMSALIFTILYRTIPRNRVAWRDVWLGGLIAGLVWEAARLLFTWYLANFARYSLVYGSVGAIIAFLLWSYVSAMILLLGAEFTAQYSQWRRAGRPLETRPPREWIGEGSKWKNR